MKVPLMAVVFVWSIDRSSIPSFWIGKPLPHHAWGDLPEEMFGIRMPGEMPTVQGPEPEIEVTITGCCCPLPARPLSDPPSELQTPGAWQTYTCPVSEVSSCWSRKIRLPTCRLLMLPFVMLPSVIEVVPPEYPPLQFALLL